MSDEQNHAHEVEYANFPLDGEGYGEPEPEYVDPLEQRLANIEGHLQAGAEAEEAEAAEEQTLEGFDDILKTWPILEVDAVADELVAKAQQIAAEMELEQGRPGLAAELLDNPDFARDVWVEHLKEGKELTGDGMFHQLAAESKAHRMDWD